MGREEDYLCQSLSLGILHERDLYWGRLPLAFTSTVSAADWRLVGRGRGGVEG